MSTMYSTLVYPQATQGVPYTRPATPASFVSLYTVSQTWDPYSANAVDRTEYWQDTAGTLTLDQVQLAVYGLPMIQSMQIDGVVAGMETANAVPVSYTSVGGVTETFQVDPNSQNLIIGSLAGWGKSQTVPAGFYWVALDNVQVPFTYADLQGLAEAMLNQNATNFTAYQNLKTQILAATTVLAVQAITWPQA
jgi:hypothetical protein